jgi:hypothetical protein
MDAIVRKADRRFEEEKRLRRLVAREHFSDLFFTDITRRPITLCMPYYCREWNEIRRGWTEERNGYVHREAALTQEVARVTALADVSIFQKGCLYDLNFVAPTLMIFHVSAMVIYFRALRNRIRLCGLRSAK